MDYLSLGRISAIILLVLIGSSCSIDPDCDFRQQMSPGVTYFIYNKEYPYYYYGRRVCRWVAEAPRGYIVDVKCDLTIPYSDSCTLDRLLVSTTGNIDLINANTYCGTGGLSLQSVYNNISLGFESAYNTPGGRYLCNITAVEDKPPGCECGWKNTRRIVGGEETGVNEYPPMAGLVDSTIREIYCGATIISPKYAVTAAHCMYNRKPYLIGLLVGDHNISVGAETPSTRLMRVYQFIQHEGYDPNTNENDIGLVITEEEIEFSQQVGPACLPFRYYAELFTGQAVQILGWGTTEFTGPKSDVLLKTTVYVNSPNTCYSTMNGTLNQMCTFNDGHDSCQSDSGGPVLWLDQTTYRVHLIGVISYGFGCATSKPAVNTRVTSYLNWIVQNSPDAQYCYK